MDLFRPQLAIGLTGTSSQVFKFVDAVRVWGRLEGREDAVHLRPVIDLDGRFAGGINAHHLRPRPLPTAVGSDPCPRQSGASQYT